MSESGNVKPNTEAEKKPKVVAPGEPYPVQSIKDALSDADKVIAREGTSRPVSKEKISEILGKKIATLGLTFSTWNQYNILTTVRGEGYKATNLYNKYIDKTYPTDEHDAQLEMFRTPELYVKIIANLDGHVLPTEDKFGNILVQAPYNINPNSAAKAAKVFYENIRDLGLLDRNNKFKFLEHGNGHPKKDETNKNHDIGHAPANGNSGSVKTTPESARYEFPLTGNKKAVLEYPTENMEIEDFDIMLLAIELLAKSKKLTLQIELKQKGATSPNKDKEFVL